jgi:hypothetical protein
MISVVVNLFVLLAAPYSYVCVVADPSFQAKCRRFLLELVACLHFLLVCFLCLLM